MFVELFVDVVKKFIHISVGCLLTVDDFIYRIEYLNRKILVVEPRKNRLFVHWYSFSSGNESR